MSSALVIWWRTCWQGPVVSAWARVHRLGHRSVSPCRRTPWWSGLLCLWGNNCTKKTRQMDKKGRIRQRLIVQAEFIYPGLDTKDILLPLTCPCVQIQSIWWQWCCWCQLSLWRKPPAPECLCSTPESATTGEGDMMVRENRKDTISQHYCNTRTVLSVKCEWSETGVNIFFISTDENYNNRCENWTSLCGGVFSLQWYEGCPFLDSM